MEYPKYEAEIYSKGEEKIYKLTKIELMGNTESRTDELVTEKDKQKEKDNKIAVYEAEMADLEQQLEAINKAE